MAELYRDDPALALEVVNGILENGDQAELLIVLRQMALAFGGMQAVAERAQLNPTQLYRTLSPQGNPALSSLSAILKAMGLRLAVQPLADDAHERIEKALFKRPGVRREVERLMREEKARADQEQALTELVALSQKLKLYD